jgi:hypothetical protein
MEERKNKVRKLSGTFFLSGLCMMSDPPSESSDAWEINGIPFSGIIRFGSLRPPGTFSLEKEEYLHFPGSSIVSSSYIYTPPPHLHLFISP